MVSIPSETMIYAICLFLLVLGILGLAAQMLLGMGHGFGGHHSAGHAHPHSHAQAHGAQSHGVRGGRASRASGWLLGLFSPLALFSLCIGAGVSGLALKNEHWSALTVALLAAGGGIAFYSVIVRPLMGLLFRFASTPSSALEGTLGSEAEVTTAFDASGRGVVSLLLDGQLVRLLATLEESDRAIRTAIRPGEKLVVTSIDTAANSCRVARL